MRWNAAYIEIEAMIQLKRYKQAEDRCKEYMKCTIEKHSKEEWSNYRAFVKAYSRLLTKLDRIAEAKQLLETLESQISQGAPSDTQEFWTLRTDIAWLYVTWARYDSSMMSPAMQVIQTYMKEMHQLEDDSLVIVSLRSLHAQTLILQARYEEAREAYQSLLSDVERIHGETHYHALGVMQNLAKVYEMLGQRRQARATLMRSFKLLQKTCAEGDPVILNATLNMSIMHESHGEHWLALFHAVAWHNGLAKIKREDGKELEAANVIIRRLLPKCATQWMLWQTIGMKAQ